MHGLRFCIRVAAAGTGHSQNNHRIGTVYNDASLQARDVEKLPLTTIYVSGPPCQPFCKGGRLAGVEDTRGGHIWDSVAYVVARGPHAFVIEEAETLLGKYKWLLDDVLSALRAVTTPSGVPIYSVEAVLLKNDENGLPSRRRRCYIYGYKKKLAVTRFELPGPIPMQSIKSILEKAPARLPSSSTCLDNLARLIDRNIPTLDPKKHTIIMDCNQSKAFGDSVSVDILPALTRTRAGAQGFFIYNQKRMMTTNEMLGAQGFPTNRFVWKGLLTDAKRSRRVSERQFCMMIGNSMAVPVLGRLLHRLLTTITIGKIPVDAPDPWNPCTTSKK